MKDLDFPSFANFLVCSLVTLSGFYWLRSFTQKHENEKRFLFRSYLCWWLSWVAWTIIWTIIAFTAWEVTHPRLLLGLSDLNAILLISVYFSLVRGNAYKPMVALIDFVGLCTVIAVGYAIFRVLLADRFDSLQSGWGLCLSAVSTLVVGWAFVMRYETRLVLIIGFIYAFAQPVAFDAILHKEPTPHLASVLDAFTFGLAALKVVWATIVTLYFTQSPLDDEKMKGITKKIFNVPPLRQIPLAFHIQTMLLLLTVVVLTTIAFGIPRLDRVNLGLMLGALGVLLAAIPVVVWLFALLRKKAEEREQRPQA